MLTEKDMQQALHARRVVPLSVPKPHGPLRLELLAAAVAQVVSYPLLHRPGDASMPDDFSKYVAMKQSGSLPDDIYWAAARDGVDTITMFRLIRSVFSLGLREAKEIIIRGMGWANSLAEYHDQIAEELLGEDGKWQLPEE